MTFQRIILLIFFVLALTAVVSAALAVGRLGDLIGGVAVVGVISIILSAIVVWLFGKWAEAKLKLNMESNRHVETMFRSGALPNGDRYKLFPQQQIAAPVKPQLNPATKGIHFSHSSIEVNAVNLVLFSMNLLGQNSNRLASNPECAQANIIGYNGRKWEAIIKYLRDSGIDIATIPGPVENGGGAYIPEDIGTAQALYDRLVMSHKRTILDSAVNALPESPHPKW
jgi:hypothetical protein